MLRATHAVMLMWGAKTLLDQNMSTQPTQECLSVKMEPPVIGWLREVAVISIPGLVYKSHGPLKTMEMVAA